MNHRYQRLFRSSVTTYVANFKRNIFLTVSVGVSILLFLGVALFLDFNYATYVKGNSRVQDNYIAVICSSEEASQSIDVITDNRTFSCQRGSLGGILGTKDGDIVNITYNVISESSFMENTYIYSGMDYYGNTDDSANSKNFEKYNVIAGRNFFQESNEVIISEEYANFFGKKAKDIINENLIMSFEDTSQPYKIVGVFSSSLAEKRMNTPIMKGIQNKTSGLDDLSLTITAIVPEGSLNEGARVGWDYYLFFRDKKDYERKVNALSKLEHGNEISDQFYYYTPASIKMDNETEWYSILQIKTALLLIVAIISGISVFGTMFNSITDRKKEIGIKKALGASDVDIIFGFMIENLLNSLVAILMAVTMASIAFLVYISYQRHMLMIDYTIQLYPVTIALFVCFAVSNVLGFSLIPAYRATQINVVDTLRDE